MKPILPTVSAIHWWKTLLLFLVLHLTTITLAQKKEGKEFRGAEASRIIRNATFVKERIGTPYPALVRLEASAKITIAEFFPWLKQSVKSNDNLNFKLLKQESDQLGFTHYRYEQTFQNIPIEFTYYYVHVKNGVVSNFNGSAVNIQQQLSHKSSLTESQALSFAKRKIGAKKYKWEDPAAESDLKTKTNDKNATYFPKGELYWLPVGETYKLAWRFDIRSIGPDYFQRIYVDAQNGQFLLSVPMQSNCDAASVNTIFNGNRTIFTDKILNVNIWGLTDNCQTAHIRVRDYNSTGCTSSTTQDILNTTNTWTTTNEIFGGTVLWATKESYLYWKNVHGRNSYDNANGNVDCFINAVFDSDPSTSACDATTDNASMSFTGGDMYVGLGSDNALNRSWSTLDIIGHEFAHAVTGASANLTYMNESGALNESFSDIFGEATEFFTTGSIDWLMGAQRTANGLGIRSMANPKADAYKDPDTYLGEYWFPGTADNGGVHTNSGVQNHWFYLLTVGGSGTNDQLESYNISGIGLTKATAIAARNLLTYLGTGSNYADARTNSIQAAIDLYGECSNEVKQVTNAWYAVGVGDAFFDANFSISNYNGRHVSCFNSCDGTATVNVTNGTSPTYSWSHGPTTQTVTGLCPGVYSVTITNENGTGCAITREVTINNTPDLVISPAPTTNFNGYGVSCFGGNNGAAAANATGGTSPYSYVWSNGQTGATITSLTAGTYNVTVTDKNGCSKSGSVTITQPPQLTTSASVTSNYNGYGVRCNGGSDGTATTTTNGGVTPYSYAWSNGQTSQNATGLMATTYTVTVTDANGCTASSSVTLTEPPPLTIDAGANKIVYFGYPDSSCTNLTATGQGGGVPPYTIQWSTGSNNATINVCPQTTTVYTVTISDANGCSATDAVTVCVIDVRCGTNLDKVTICHRTNSNTSPFETLCVNLTAAKNHFTMHPEDQLAACGTVKVCNDAARGLMDGATTMLYKPATTFIEAYPNPLSGTGVIKFLSTAEDRGSLKLFDVNGKQISVLYEGRLQANFMNNVLLDSGPLSKGVYFIQLTTQKGTSERVKLVIAR